MGVHPHPAWYAPLNIPPIPTSEPGATERDDMAKIHNYGNTCRLELIKADLHRAGLAEQVKLSK